MMKAIITAVITAAMLAAAYGLPGDVVVISDKEVRPDEAAGLYYLGSCSAGYIYNGSSAAVSAVAPYRLLSRDAQARDYYIVWAPEWVRITPEAFAHLGTAVRLSDSEILAGLERGFGPSALRAVEHRIELIKLTPVTPVGWRVDAEEPPAKKDPRIEAAINTITAEEYAGYIQKLQDFKTRCNDTPGCDAARDYLCGFFADRGLNVTLFPFNGTLFLKAAYVRAPDTVYVATGSGTIKRTRDGGNTWDTVMIERTCEIPAWDWFNETVGCVASYNSTFGRTEDGGDTWNVYKIHGGYPFDRYSPADLCFVNSQIGWIVGRFWPSTGGNRGCVFRTLDGGRTWQERLIPDGFVPSHIRFADLNHGWMAGRRSTAGYIYYTDDGGATWRECAQPGESVIRDIAVVGLAEAWATDFTDKLLHTTDGTTWFYVAPGLNYKYEFIEFPDAGHGFAADDTLIATEDGGATWHEVAGAPQIEYWILAFADNDYGIVGDIGGEHLYKTDDGGKTFESIVEGMDRTSENVIAERRGVGTPEEIVIIGGHFDSVSDCVPSFCPGAEDNASGTACAMAAARALKHFDFTRTVRYVAFGAEEMGVVGSEAYAEYCAHKGEKIIAVLNADMVSYDEDIGGRDDFAAGTGSNGRWLYDYLVAIGALYGHRIIYDTGWSVSDDVPFERVGYAAIGVIEGGVGAGGFMQYPYYHTTEDTLDKLHPDLGVRFVRDYAAMLAHLAGISDVGVNDPRPAAAVPFSRAFAVYPNPYCYASTTGGVNFVGIKSPAEVEIYDLAGRRVASVAVAAPADEFVWRPGGEALSPGVYLYRVDGLEQHKAGKIVLTR
jgi:photosystem II stability/assembly factor-like uncharacterized protein